jgi:RNA polymerase sigma factor (sigma-70 family)
MTVQNSLDALRRRAEEDGLVAAAQTGDKVMFARLVRHWHGRLLAHALRLTRRKDLAEDAVQAAWIEIIRGLSALRDERAFAAWAYRIVTRRLLRSFHGFEMDAGPVPPEEVSVDRARDGEVAILARADLACAMKTLSPVQRAAVALHYFEGLSIAEVAVALDAPAGTIKTRLLHARAQLRAHLEGGNHDGT